METIEKISASAVWDNISPDEESSVRSEYAKE